MGEREFIFEDEEEQREESKRKTGTERKKNQIERWRSHSDTCLHVEEDHGHGEISPTADWWT